MATEDKKDEDLKLTEQQDGTVIIGDPPEPEKKPEPKTEEPGDDKLASGDDDQAPDEEQGHAEETAEEAEARRERNRQRRAANKERRKEHIESLKRELAARDQIINEMNERLAVVERKSTGSEMAQLEAYEKEAVQVYNHYKQVSQQAIEQANGAAATDAQEKMFAAKQRYEQIQNIKKAMQSSRQPTTHALDPRLKTNAEEFMSRHSWLDLDGRDEDSFLVKQLDSRLAAEGWNPTTKEYWEELESRMKKYLPHRTNLRHNKGQVSGNSGPSPVAAAGSTSGQVKSSGSYTLSAERVQALKDAGLWDDPAQRAAAIKRFQQYDKGVQA